MNVEAIEPENDEADDEERPEFDFELYELERESERDWEAEHGEPA